MKTLTVFETAEELVDAFKNKSIQESAYLVFENEFDRVYISGSDCYALDPNITLKSVLVAMSYHLGLKIRII